MCTPRTGYGEVQEERALCAGRSLTRPGPVVPRSGCPRINRQGKTGKETRHEMPSGRAMRERPTQPTQADTQQPPAIYRGDPENVAKAYRDAQGAKPGHPPRMNHTGPREHRSNTPGGLETLGLIWRLPRSIGIASETTRHEVAPALMVDTRSVCIRYLSP